MAIRELRVRGYRSVRDVDLTLGPVNVLVGPNGCGKSNLYRAVHLLAAAADGRLARTFAEEGGMPSALWAGERHKGRVRMTVAVTLDDLAYELSCGLPTPANTAFCLDPEVKEEHVWFLRGAKKVCLLERDHALVQARDAEGNRVSFTSAAPPGESALAELREPERFPALAALRQEFLGWRFYHDFRTDAGSPLRQPQVGVRTTALAHDGRDLAAALQTIREIGDREALAEAVDRAFPGAALHVDSPRGRFSVVLQLPEFRRPFDARELSDGTLRYLCLLAALLSPRPPAVLSLNEPETSIHADLLEPLARLIAAASRQSQLWVTTHSEALAGHIERHTGAAPIRLEKRDGATRLVRAPAPEGD
jgi:predicted ATPase